MTKLKALEDSNKLLEVTEALNGYIMIERWPTNCCMRAWMEDNQCFYIKGVIFE